MAESWDGPEPPKNPPLGYLPRIKYQEKAEDSVVEPDGEIPVESEAAPAATPPGRKPKDKIRPADPSPGPVAPKPRQAPIEKPAKKKKSAGAAGKGREKAGVLIEPTPGLDTYDSRRRVRAAVGMALGALGLIAGALIFRAVRSNQAVEVEVSIPGPATPPPPAAPSARELESQASQLLEDARQFEKGGKIELAMARLAKIGKEYPKTSSAAKARACLDRYEQGLPLFPGGPAVLARKAEPQAPDPETEDAKPPVVVAVAPGPKTSAGPVGVALTPPPAPPEPRRDIGAGLARADVPPRPLPAGFRARLAAGVFATGWPLEITCDKDGSTLVLIPADTFVQGRDDGPAESKPAHKVRLSTYYIDQHEVTVRQFEIYRGKPASDNLRPVVNVSLAEAKAYALWAGKAIPTEAQWEMAARGVDARAHPWGNHAASWGDARPPRQVDPVMAFPQDLSPYGAFDLAGNAWEWTGDFFDTKAYQAFKATVPANPSGPPRARTRQGEVVVKGGSKEWDASWRMGMKPESRSPYLGFRCVLNVEAAPSSTTPIAPGVRPPDRRGGPIPF